RFAGELLGILAQHLLDSFNPSRQTKALKRAVHILPSRLKAGHERERWGHGSAGHGVALLCGFGTPSLTAQGGQRLHPYFNNGRDIPCHPGRDGILCWRPTTPVAFLSPSDFSWSRAQGLSCCVPFKIASQKPECVASSGTRTTTEGS